MQKEIEIETERTNVWIPRVGGGRVGVGWTGGLIDICTPLTVHKIESIVYLRDICSVLHGDVNGKEIPWGYMYTYKLIHLAVQQKLTQHCKATILQENQFEIRQLTRTYCIVQGTLLSNLYEKRL